MSGKPGRSGPPQNINALKHGLFLRAPNGKQLRDRRVRLVVLKLRSVMPWLTDADVPGLRTLARLELTDAAIEYALKVGGPVHADGGAKKLTDQQRQIAIAKLPYYREFGMTPASRKVIGLSARQEVSLSDYLEARYSPQDATTTPDEASPAGADDRPAEAERTAPAPNLPDGDHA